MSDMHQSAWQGAGLPTQQQIKHSLTGCVSVARTPAAETFITLFAFLWLSFYTLPELHQTELNTMTLL